MSTSANSSSRMTAPEIIAIRDELEELAPPRIRFTRHLPPDVGAIAFHRELIIREEYRHLADPLREAAGYPMSVNRILVFRSEILDSAPPNLTDAFHCLLAHLAAPSEDSTETGRFERSSPLRAQDDQNDTMGAETDVASEIGEAESWFRKQRSE